VLGDPQLLRELVVNLLDNALKYNARWDGSKCRRATRTANRFSKLRTADTTSVAKIWIDYCSPFDVRDKRRGYQHRLGLSIIHNIVRAHGGRLTLHALLDGGLTVRVTFPHSVAMSKRFSNHATAVRSFDVR